MNALSFAVFLVVVVAVSAGGWGGWGHGHAGSAVLAGPSGTVVRDGHAVVGAGHGAWGGWAGGWGGPWGGAWGGWAGHGHEGQWIPDHNEQHYDDGSYKPWVYGH